MRTIPEINEQMNSITTRDVIQTIKNLKKITGKQYYIKAYKGGYILKEDGAIEKHFIGVDLSEDFYTKVFGRERFGNYYIDSITQTKRKVKDGTSK